MDGTYSDFSDKMNPPCFAEMKDVRNIREGWSRSKADLFSFFTEIKYKNKNSLRTVLFLFLRTKHKKIYRESTHIHISDEIQRCRCETHPTSANFTDWDFGNL